MILICYILSILCGAAGDALDHRGKKIAGHILQGSEILIWLTLFILALIAQPDYTTTQLVLIALSYFALRFFLFDYTWNLFAGKPLGYIGTTSLYDKLISKLAPAMVHFLKVILGVVAIIYLLI